MSEISRYYAGCGVLQTPIFNTFLEEISMTDFEKKIIKQLKEKLEFDCKFSHYFGLV